MSPSSDLSSPRTQELRDSIKETADLDEVLNTLPRSVLERISANLGILDAPLADLPSPEEIRASIVTQWEETPLSQIENVIDSIQRHMTRTGVSAIVAARTIHLSNCKSNHPSNAVIALALESYLFHAERAQAAAAAG